MNNLYLEAKTIASCFKTELGFVNRAALYASEKMAQLECIIGVGFCNYHHRRDDQTTIYEIAVLPEHQRQGWGRLLFYRVLCSAIEHKKTKIVAKCPEELPSNKFYQKMGFTLHSIEQGRKRRLNRWQYDIRLPLLFYCADGGRNQYSEIASELGWLLGLRSDQARTNTHCAMVDNHWKNYDHQKHLQTVMQQKPLLATAKDIENIKDLPEILEQAKELSNYAGRVLLIPKIEASLPINYWLAFSVPSKYGGTEIPCNWFKSRFIHLLGGSPNAQAQYAKQLNVVSIDSNYAMNLARWGKASWQGSEVKQSMGCYESFRLSMTKQKSYWWKEWKWEEEPLSSLAASI